MGLFDFLFGQKRQSRGVDQQSAGSAGGRRIVLVAGDGSFDLDVVGESKYQDALERIAGGKQRGGCEIETRASLLPEPSNPYDHNAVIVAIDGEIVGYLRRDDAALWASEVFGRGIAGVGCDALIVGGWDNGRGDVGSFGVKLDVSYPITIIAENE